MVIWHTADGWLTERPSAEWFFWVRLCGAMAAPLFLLLAGVGVALREDTSSETIDRRLLARGAGIFLLGVALQFQHWLLDALGILSLPGAFAAGGVGLFFYIIFKHLRADGLKSKGREDPRLVVVAAIGLVAIGLSVGTAGPRDATVVLRGDVLHTIGLFVGLASLRPLRTRPLLVAGLLVVASVGFGAQPSISAWRFPPLPWLSYGFIGLAIFRWRTHRSKARARDVDTSMLVVGLALILFCSERQPVIYRLLRDAPELTPAIRIGFRVGVAILLGGVVFVVGSFVPQRGFGPLALLGRHSLLIYWLHLELSYGIASRPLRSRLDVVQWVTALTMLIVLLIGIAWSWDKRKKRRRVFSFEKS